MDGELVGPHRGRFEGEGFYEKGGANLFVKKVVPGFTDLYVFFSS